MRLSSLFLINRYKLIFLLFMLMLSGVAYSYSLKSLQVDFSRSVRTTTGDNTSFGTIYYSESGLFKLKITEPLNQWLFFNGDNYEIYYPDDKKAFRFFSKLPTGLPFFETFIGVIKEDYGLSDIGYTIEKHEVRADTLFMYWKPPDYLKENFGRYLICYLENKIILASSKNAEHEVTVRSYYSDHVEFNSVYFPMTIKTVKYTRSDSTVETVNYSGEIFNQDLPENILDMKIPSDIAVKEIEW